MRILFSRIFSDSGESYLRKKLERGFRRQVSLGAEINEDHFDKQIAKVINNQLGVSVPIAQPDAFYKITSQQEAEIEARKRCVLATLLRESPLLEGETVQEDLFTFLQGPFDTLKPNTVVLRRTTNMSEAFYILDDVQVVDGNLVFIEPAPVPRTAVSDASRVVRASARIKFDAMSIAKRLGGGLVDGIAGTIGGLIFEAIFPPGVPDYFDDVYKEIRNIVKQELTSALIDNINGRINGVVAWTQNTYKPRKESGASRKDLSDMVDRQVELLYNEAVYTLMEERYAKPGVAVFTIAAGVHLALMQEQALVDPQQMDPEKSSYATSVKLNAQTYAYHLTKTYDEIADDRQKAVVMRYDPMVDQDPGSPFINMKDRYRWYDTIDNKSGDLHEEYVDKTKKRHSGKEEAEADRQNYLRGIMSQLDYDLGAPKDLAAQYLKLTNKPIPSR